MTLDNTDYLFYVADVLWRLRGMQQCGSGSGCWGSKENTLCFGVSLRSAVKAELSSCFKLTIWLSFSFWFAHRSWRTCLGTPHHNAPLAQLEMTVNVFDIVLLIFLISVKHLNHSVFIDTSWRYASNFFRVSLASRSDFTLYFWSRV